MIPSAFQPLVNHLWQSTLFAAVAGLLASALRKNRAQTRYWLWLAASVKFLIPFSLLVDVGSHWGRHAAPTITPSVLSYAIEQASQPFSVPTLSATTTATPASSLVDWVLTVLSTIWAVGFAALTCSWWRRWRGLRAALRTASPLDLQIGMEAMISPAFAEPGVFGVRRPVLLLPAGITDRLTRPQLEAIVAHERCHIRRRDNLATVVHMGVEALFWFHPLVWWLGARLVEERERACDEEVLLMGSEPQVYAEGILKICELYLESPLPCVSGVTGANLRKRIEEIMSNRIGIGLSFARKTALAIAGAAAIGVPILVGVLNAPVIQAQSSATAPAATTPEFDVVLIEPIDPHHVIHNQQGSPYMPGGHFLMRNTTVRWLLVQAYAVPMIRCDLTALPDWAKTTHYTIEAKPTQGFPNLPPAKNIQQIKLMLQAMLADRFKVTLHHETRQTSAYEMTLAKDALKNVTSGDANQPPDGDFNARNDIVHLVGKNVTMSVFGDWISQLLGRPVVDKTGLKGVYNFDILRQAEAGAQPADGGCGVDCRSLTIGALSELGLKLRATTAPDDFLVLDHMEKPRPN